MKIEGHIRPARTQDMAQCADILNEWIDETDWMPRIHSHDDVKNYYRTEVAAGRKVFVVTADTKIAGMIVIAPDNIVTALYVRRGFRRQGVGRMLLSRAKRECRSEVRLWTFQRNQAAQKFYAHEGFVEINRTDGDNEEGLPDLLLEWRADDET